MSHHSRSLDSIPYDVLYQIVSSLDCEDFTNLSRVNRALNAMMRDESMAKKAIEAHELHTKEGREALRSKSGYRRAIGRLFDIKEAFATAQPYLVSMLAYGTAFLYNDGCLCYVCNDELRVLDVHNAARVERVIDIDNLLSRIFRAAPFDRDSARLTLLNFNEGILAFLVELEQPWLIAVYVQRRTPTGSKTGRLRLKTQLSSIEKLFVRHNGSYLYYGTHSVTGYGRWSRYPRWAISCVDLRTGQHVTQKPIVMDQFAGDDVGQTVSFEMYRDTLYGVSNVLQFEEEEVDWTSFYTWFCIPPCRDNGEIKLQYVWRRQHREGPINDSWNDFSLRKDEATGRPIILECRREWQGGGSENRRTYYSQPLPTPEEIFGNKEHLDLYQYYQDSTTSELPDEPLRRTLDSSNKATYAPPRKRLRRYYHTEYKAKDEPSRNQNQDREFILAKTKYRTYHLPALAFVDLVNDPRPDPNNPHAVPRDRLRLRTVSRKRKSPIDYDGKEGEPGIIFKPEIADQKGQPIERSEERFVSRGIWMWPPEDAPRKLEKLLCPAKRAGNVHAIADERSVIYSVNQDGDMGDHQAIILISFDPGLGFIGLERLCASGDDSSGGKRRRITISSSGEEGPAVYVDIEMSRVRDYGRSQGSGQVSRTVVLGTGKSASTGQGSSFIKEEPAMYLSIRRGYWLR